MDLKNQTISKLGSFEIIETKPILRFEMEDNEYVFFTNSVN